MVDDAINSCYDFLLDHITQKEILKYLKTLGLDDKLFIINVFTNLKDLARNLESRRKEGDRRGVFAFTQFSERYIKTSDDDEKKIEKVNKEINEKNLSNNGELYDLKFKNIDVILKKETKMKKRNDKAG